jgi:hypothetical protein
MSRSLQHCLKHLELISNIKNSRLRKAVLHDISVNECYFIAIREMLLNALRGNVRLSPAHKSKLRRHKKAINTFTTPKAKYSKKKKANLVKQSGGFLPFLIPAVIGTLLALK